MDQFEFYTVESTEDRTFVLSWHWRSSADQVSKKGFASFDACLANATECGFRVEQLAEGTFPLDLISTGATRVARRRRPSPKLRT